MQSIVRLTRTGDACAYQVSRRYQSQSVGVTSAFQRASSWRLMASHTFRNSAPKVSARNAAAARYKLASAPQKRCSKCREGGGPAGTRRLTLRLLTPQLTATGA